MKKPHLLIFLALFAAGNLHAKTATAAAKPAAAAVSDHKPQTSGDMVIRTRQQDAELKDWIIGLQAENQRNSARAEAAEQSQAAVRAALSDAVIKSDGLQSQIDALQREHDAAVEHDRKTAAQNARLKTILGVEAAAVAALLCLWLKVPALSPPWGIAATVAAPAAAFGIIRFLV